MKITIFSSSPSLGLFPKNHRSYSLESCRQFRSLFVEVREQASKAIGFAKMLRKVIEILTNQFIRSHKPVYPVITRQVHEIYLHLNAPM